MKKGMIALLVVLGIVLLLGGGAVSTYNTLVSLDEGVTGAWSQVENVYQRRQDLIPNLVETVKGYAAHERETLQAVVEARSKATSIQMSPEMLGNAEQFAKFDAAQGALSSALSRLMVVVEKYPDLKANQNFLALQTQLEGTENRIAVERRRYNEMVQAYNTKRRRFLARLIASIGGFEEKTYFKAQAGAEVAPQVKF